jgi:biotin carboxylase
MNPRLVGDQMGSHMIEIATGQNPAHAIVDVACGRQLRWRPTRSRGVAIHRLTMPRSGYFDGIANVADLAAHDGVEIVNELGARGQWIETAESNQGVVGSIIVSHASAHEAMTLATRLAADAEIRVAR